MSAASTREPLAALIVGCGAIAGGYDEAASGDTALTHAGAYAHHGRFRIAACVEPDGDRREQFMARWNVTAGFATLEQCITTGMAFDVASVCVPTATHESALQELLDLPVRAVFAEKPLTHDLGASTRLVEAYAEAARPLAVNYLRRWDRAMAALAEEIAAGTWGAVQSVTGFYGKGLMNCGSHLIDLLHMLIGPLEPELVTRRRLDWRGDDPTLDAVLSTASGMPVYLVGSDAKQYFSFEAVLTFDKGRIHIEEQGRSLRTRLVRDDPVYVGYRTLDPGRAVETALGGAMLAAVDNMARCLDEGMTLASDGRSALRVERVCGQLMALAGALGPEKTLGGIP